METKETFVEQLRADYWGEPGSVGEEDSAETPWHPSDEVWARLSGERQAELEARIGTPITSRVAAESDAVP